MGKSLNYEEVYDYVYKNNFILISNEYLGCKSKISLRDSLGYYYYVPFDNFRTNKKLRKVHKSNPYTIKNIKLWLILNNKSFELVSNVFEGAKNKLKWKCLMCYEIFKSSWSDISHDSGCPYCAGRQVGLSNCLATKRPDLASEWHPTFNSDLTPYNVAYTSSQKIWWQCSKNSKHEWQSSIYNRNNGRGCPYCAGKLPSEDYNLLVTHPDLCKEWDYNKNSKLPNEYTPWSGKSVWWICKDCGYEWKNSISARNGKNKCGCPECNKSKGEKKISEVCEIKKITYIPQKTFKGLVGLGGGLLSYDFYLPKYNLLIEYQGEQHEKPIDFKGLGFKYAKQQFKIQQEHDKRKREYAQNNNIKLLEIWYWDFDRIEEILNNAFITKD